MDKYLIFSNISINPSTQDGPIKVTTSDGKDLSEYFHITSFNGLEASPDKITILTLSIYAAIGTETDENKG